MGRKSIVIRKKCWPELFQDILAGKKTFDVRIADFDCKAGDTLVLREWDPKKGEYTGRTIEKKVTYVLKTKDCEKFWLKEEIDKYGFRVIAFK